MTNPELLPSDAPPPRGGVLQRLRRLLRDSCATVSVEFAFALPILCAMTFALYEVTQGVITYMKVVDVANTVSDLIGQRFEGRKAASDDQDFDNYYIAGAVGLAPNVGAT